MSNNKETIGGLSFHAFFTRSPCCTFFSFFTLTCYCVVIQRNFILSTVVRSWDTGVIYWADTSNCIVARDWPKVWADLPQQILGVRLPTIGHNCVSINCLCHMIVKLFLNVLL